MKIGFIDCSLAGCSGDMLVGALLDAGLEIFRLEEEMKRYFPSLNLELSSEVVSNCGIVGRNFSCKLGDKEANIEELLELTQNSSLPSDMKTKVTRILSKIKEKEEKLHNHKDKLDNIWHKGKKLCRLDTLIDIVAFSLGINLLKIEKLYTSSINLGELPGPLTLALLEGSNIPVFSDGTRYELTTPTAISIILEFASYSPLPSIFLDKVGRGIGSYNLEDKPDMVSILVGNLYSSVHSYKVEELFLIETNIDDLSPQIYEYVMNKLFEAGAKDVFLSPIYMKRNRIGTLLSVLAAKDNLDDLISIIFEETTTLGLRVQNIQRYLLGREEKRLNTKYGEIRVKVAKFKDRTKLNIQYEDLVNIAKQKNIPLINIYKELLKLTDSYA